MRVGPLQAGVAAIALGTFGGLGLSVPSAAQTSAATFAYAGASLQPFAVPADVCRVAVDAFGAQGGQGDAATNAGALGGRATGTITVTPGETLQIVVGGQGGAGSSAVGFAAGGTGGFNGGGAGGDAQDAGLAHSGGGGGGASDVRRGGSSIINRVLVAGGGGGTGGSATTAAGAGGGAGDPGGNGTTAGGGAGATSATGGAGGANQNGGTAGTGVLSLGGTGGNNAAPIAQGGGGGGGGQYGGGGGGADLVGVAGASGGGGSGFGPVGTTFATGARSGNGQVTLSWTVEPGCQPVPASPCPSGFVEVDQDGDGTPDLCVGSVAVPVPVVANPALTG